TGSLSSANRHAIPQIRQRKRCDAVSSVCGSEQSPKRCVLANRQQLPLAQCIPTWCETERDGFDFAQKRCRTIRRRRAIRRPWNCAVGINTLECNDVIKTHRWLAVIQRTTSAGNARAIGKK